MSGRTNAEDVAQLRGRVATRLRGRVDFLEGQIAGLDTAIAGLSATVAEQAETIGHLRAALAHRERMLRRAAGVVVDLTIGDRGASTSAGAACLVIDSILDDGDDAEPMTAGARDRAWRAFSALARRAGHGSVLCGCGHADADAEREHADGSQG